MLGSRTRLMSTFTRALLIASDGLLEKPLTIALRQQRVGDGYPLLDIVQRQLMWNP